MGGCIVEELGERDHGGSSAFALLHGKGTEGNEHGGVDSAGIVQ